MNILFKALRGHHRDRHMEGTPEGLFLTAKARLLRRRAALDARIAELPHLRGIQRRASEVFVETEEDELRELVINLTRIEREVQQARGEYRKRFDRR